MLGHPLSPLGGILNFCSQLEEFSLDLLVFESVNNYGYFLLLKMVFSFVLIEDLNMVVCGLSLLNRFVKWLAIILTCFHSFAVYWFLWLITNTGFDLIFFIFFHCFKHVGRIIFFDFSNSYICLYTSKSLLSLRTFPPSQLLLSIIIIIIIELTQGKAILKNTAEIEPQPVVFQEPSSIFWLFQAKLSSELVLFLL